jgi:hypothetical protein
VEIELLPDDGPGARDAVQAALQALRLQDAQGTRAYRSDWRRTALAEAVERDPGYALSPRSSRGATRA